MNINSERLSEEAEQFEMPRWLETLAALESVKAGNMTDEDDLNAWLNICLNSGLNSGLNSWGTRNRVAPPSHYG